MNSLASSQEINEQFKLLANDGNQTDLFGSAISTKNNRIAVGAESDWANNAESGSVYIFNASTGTQTYKLLASDAEHSDRFGHSVALDDRLLVVGAWGNDDNGPSSGSAYIFDSFTGSELFKLIPDDIAERDTFGNAVAIEDNIVVVGSRSNTNNFSQYKGAVYLFDATTGNQTAKILAGNGYEQNYFGSSVAISDGIIAIGAPGFDPGGSAYLFDTTTGQHTFQLTPTDGMDGDSFGESIDIDDGLVVVGASWADPNGHRSGAAYIFDAHTGKQLHKLVPEDNAEIDAFGNAVSIQNGIVAVGAPGDDDTSSAAGSVYLFDAKTGMQITKFLASDGQYGDELGTAVALDRNSLVSAAMKDDDQGLSSGSAYTFELPILSCDADLNEDGMLDFFDVSAFLTAFRAHDAAADFNNDGEFNFFDVTNFLAAFAAGCP